MSPQASILAIIYIILFIFMFISGILHRSFKVTMGGIISVLVSIMICALIVYDTACLTMGSCTIWSWIRTILYALLPLIMIIVVFLAFFVKKGNKNVTEEELNKFIEAEHFRKVVGEEHSIFNKLMKL